jgi:hypothetical protein
MPGTEPGSGRAATAAAMNRTSDITANPVAGRELAVQRSQRLCNRRCPP